MPRKQVVLFPDRSHNAIRQRRQSSREESSETDTVHADSAGSERNSPSV